MRFFSLVASTLAVLLIGTANSQFVKTLPTGMTTIQTPGHRDWFVRFKQPPPEICRTRNPKQKQYTGHITIKENSSGDPNQDYPINNFFWFIEAEKDPENAPLTIWLSGGPGISSLMGLMTEVGPCEPKPFGDNHIETETREFSWDGKSNMIFIDQPNQVGYSFDLLRNGSTSFADPNNIYTTEELALPWDQQPLVAELTSTDGSPEAFMKLIRTTVVVNGTFATGSNMTIPRTTQMAARAMWSFLQTWLINFPQYNPETNGINLFTEAYGGKYGPTFFKYFEEQNERRARGELKSDIVELHLSSLGILNGCIDTLIEMPMYPEYALNNPYGIESYNSTVAKAALNRYYDKGGCKDMLLDCRETQKKLDPENFGLNEEVNTKCRTASMFCFENLRNPFIVADRSFYDITQPMIDAFPPRYYDEYLNNATVQEGVGAPLNHTDGYYSLLQAFEHVGDSVRGGQLEEIEYLLDRGVRVALIYGDRGYMCTWKGGEQVSLAIDHSHKDTFAKAGYQDIKVNPGYVGGHVRQAGNLTFARVYQAGHHLPAYQPETAFRIFERVITGKSVATGEDIDPATYVTTGPSNSTTILKAPPMRKATCYLRNIATCTYEEWLAIGSHQGTLNNGVWTPSNSTFTLGIYQPGGDKDEEDKDKKDEEKQQGGGEFEGDQEPQSGAGIARPSLSILLFGVLCLMFTA